jgi:zinc protease
MVTFEEFVLDNGLRVIVHEDPTVQIAVMNILYDVGSRDEDPNKTGFAHLFEHLMFGGSVNIPSYDEPLQRVGGENNAFTNTDITNYYLSVPAQNLETGFWLESDRMLSLSFDPRVLEVQQKVVIEEFKQRYLDQPYGDVWLKLRPLAYQVHPYQWATIGKKVEHIEQATMADVKDFFYHHYLPINAVLVVAGNVTMKQVRGLAEKWFGPIPAGSAATRRLPAEPTQKEKRLLTVEARVPANALYKCYHMPGRFDEAFYAVDLLSDILGRGQSSRLFNELVKEKELFTNISSFTMGSLDPGLMVISGRLRKGVDPIQAEIAVDAVVKSVQHSLVDRLELEKVQTQAVSTLQFDEVELLNRAMNLALGKLSGDANRVNRESEYYLDVTEKGMQEAANQFLNDANASTLYYNAVG